MSITSFKREWRVPKLINLNFDDESLQEKLQRIKNKPSHFSDSKDNIQTNNDSSSQIDSCISANSTENADLMNPHVEQ